MSRDEGTVFTDDKIKFVPSKSYYIRNKDDDEHIFAAETAEKDSETVRIRANAIHIGRGDQANSVNRIDGGTTIIQQARDDVIKVTAINGTVVTDDIFRTVTQKQLVIRNADDISDALRVSTRKIVTTFDIEDISSAYPAIVETKNNHSFLSGDKIRITNISSVSSYQLNGKIFTVSNPITSNSFALAGVDSRLEYGQVDAYNTGGGQIIHYPQALGTIAHDVGIFVSAGQLKTVPTQTYSIRNMDNTGDVLQIDNTVKSMENITISAANSRTILSSTFAIRNAGNNGDAFAVSTAAAGIDYRIQSIQLVGYNATATHVGTIKAFLRPGDVISISGFSTQFFNNDWLVTGTPSATMFTFFANQYSTGPFPFQGFTMK